MTSVFKASLQMNQMSCDRKFSFVIFFFDIGSL